MQCGLLGEKLGHSYSPQIHSYLADYSYGLFEKKPEEIGDFLVSGDFIGLNVTIPYKKAVIPYCTQLSDCAKRLGAVNTIVKRQDGTLIGHNTDYFGFSSMLDHSGIDVEGKKALVLGSGGASVTVVAVLEERGAEVVVVSRSGSDNYMNLHRHSDTALIVNATPVGMYPNTGKSPVDISVFSRLEGVLDLIYNPARTQLLLDAEARGLVTENGLWMLVAQAKESAEWFTGSKIPDDRIPYIHEILRRQMGNIVLIGMPGCGKSTVGKLLAKMTGKQFVDADIFIEETTQKTIPEIFAQSGEAGFRKLETSALEVLGMRSGLVIATGGGCVTKEENYPLLHQNGTIIWLQRAIDKLPFDGRPLSKAGNLEAMYAIRKPLYDRFADISVENDSTPDKTAQNILNRGFTE